ncbi:hypothetical protein CROQUDRAFT_668204 [Cronartium quercuum f. sp. fusiforme G11]|uniref:t-SNARE coiled-coil homology domain-containing protein n=1 Tax=Cronartium quercuum f. sp. fusiforme G11 TaxID=708437 RepID=A0A9P6NWL2_9BASI|nr:hypothetical protein CROQUDRAFT_668204 [Cronartium quercuum f. sp. fusiforme G11]
MNSLQHQTQHSALTRSRTLLFLSFRDTRPSSTSTYPPNYSSNEYQQPLLNSNSTTIDINSEEESSALPPKWADYSDEVENLIEQIKPKMVQLEKLTAKHVLPTFTDRSAEEREIDKLTNDITRQFRSCQAQIRKIADCGREIETELNQQKTRKFSERDLRMVKNVQIALATKVQNLSGLFQKRQRTYLTQLKGFQGYSTTNNHFVIEDDPPPSRSTFHNSDQQQQQQQQQTYKSANEDLIHQRDREIEGIAQSIAELADMFKDLGNLVLDQGTLLDRIDYNVEQMATDVRGAVDELKVATKYQARSGKCRLIFLLILLIFAAILILIFKPRHQPTQPSLSTSTTSTRRSTAMLDRRWKVRGRRKALQ